MNSSLFLALFSGLGIFYLILGWYASRSIKTISDYFLAGRNLSLTSLSFTLIATQLGGNLLLGSAQWAFDYGIYGILYALGMGFGFLLLSTGFAAKLHKSKASTTAELFELRYNSPTLKKIASFISILSLCGILVSLVVAARALITGLGIQNELIFGLFWLFVIVYTMIGGLKAVVVTDVVQVIFIILSIGGLFLFCLLFTPAPLVSLGKLCTQQSLFDSSSLTIGKIGATFTMPALFSLIEQDLAQRFFAARTHKIALLSAFIACLFIVFFGIIPVYFGMQAQLTGIAGTDASPLVRILEVITNGNIIFIGAVCGIIAAITSTADSLLCAISSNICQDFNIGKGTKNRLLISQVITFLVGVIAFIAAYGVNKNIIDITIGSYELSVSCLLIPMLFSLYRKNLNKNAAIVSALFGFFGFVFFAFYPIPIAKEAATLTLSLIGYWIGNNIKRRY